MIIASGPGHQQVARPRLQLRPNHLWRIAVIVSLAADVLEDRGITDRCAAAVGTHGHCLDHAHTGPLCAWCAVIAARLAYVASGAAELRDVPEAVIADAMSNAQTFAEIDGLVIDPPDTATAVEIMRKRSRILFRMALPIEGLHVVGRRQAG
jgi:hypothetical protein